MKRIIVILMCACMTLCVMAETARLSRAQLQQTPIVKTHPARLALTAGKDQPEPLPQVMKKRHLNQADERNTANTSDSPLLSSSRLKVGSRIAMIDAYDFDWDNGQGVATVIDSTYSIMGKYCAIKRDSNGWCLSHFYDKFDIPIEFDFSTGTVKIEAGVELARLIGSTGDSFIGAPADRDIITWTLYAMPLSWLEGDEDYQDIYGTVTENSITFSDDFAFLVHETVGSSLYTSWGLSPIYKNVNLYVPNGVHRFSRRPLSTPVIPSIVDENGHGHGGVAPRPITPRPGNTKPVTPRSWRESRDQGKAAQESAIDKEVEKEFRRSQSVLTEGPALTVNFVHDSADIYIYQLDDTTVMVYNLFGKDYSWNYMYEYPDHSLRFPAQPICLNEDGDTLYNCSNLSSNGDTLVWGNKGTYMSNIVTWNTTYLCSEAGSLEVAYLNNKIIIGINTSGQNHELSVPENLAVTPNTNTASVAWEDDDDALWNLRYRPYIDMSSGSVFWNLNAEDALDDWSVEDVDQDGDCWHTGTGAGGDGDYCFQSNSYYSGVAFDPDNWLISPTVMLGGVLWFSAWGNGDFPDFPDNFRVYVITEDCEYLDDEPLTDDITTATEKTEYEIDLSSYNGQLGCIAFRHYNSYDNYYLKIDDNFIGDPDAEVVEPEAWRYVRYIDDTNYTIQGLDPETEYEVQVKAIDAYGSQSYWTETVYFTTQAELQPMPGDVNKDGNVTIGDVTTLIDHLLSNDYGESDDFSPSNSDVTGDDAISIADVTALIDFLLGGTW